jgi:3-keto-disaccharide hydrolase
MRGKFLVLVALLIVSSATICARADTVFFDDFNSGVASPVWSNTLGNWTADGSVYRAQQPDNFPNTHSFVSTMPSLTDFSVTVDVNAARDGGVWLRASSDPTTQIGVTGILLIFLNDGAGSARPNSLFWHEVGEQYGAQLNVEVDQYVGSFSLRIDVQGNTYSAFVNGSSTPATTFISDKFTSGYVGLYDHGIFPGDVQSFDNFRLSVSVPGPIAGAGPPGLILAGGGLLGWWRRRTANA